MFKYAFSHCRHAFNRSANKRLFSSRSGFVSNRFYQRRYITLGLFGLSAITGLTIYNENSIKLEKNIKGNIPIGDSVSVDSSISAFPTNLFMANQANLDTDYQLLGYGIRSVTFVGFKVYGIAIYIATDDVSKTKKILNQNYLSTFGTENHSLTELLTIPEFSTEIISKLLEENIRFTARISPVRNTDFNHLKDGLIKSILAHPQSKELKEAVNNGLEELRDVFNGHRGSVPKDHALWISKLPQGKLKISYENPQKNLLIHMGQINEPVISKLLFLQYLSGKKPLSEPLRKSCNDGLVGL